MKKSNGFYRTKNIISEMKNSIDGFNSRLDTTKDITYKLQYR